MSDTQSVILNPTSRSPQEREMAPTIYVTGPQVQRRYQKSHITIWRWIHDATLGFPKPLVLNRLNYWRLADLEAWEAGQANKAAAPRRNTAK